MATTAPKYFETSRASSRGGRSAIGPVATGVLSATGDGCEIDFALSGPRGFPFAMILLGAFPAFIVGIAAAYYATADPESGGGYVLFAGLFGLAALAIWLHGSDTQNEFLVREEGRIRDEFAAMEAAMAAYQQQAQFMTANLAAQLGQSQKSSK